MIRLFKFILVNIVETLLRFFPIPCKPGLIRIGNPDKNSPVFLTCNYHLTVERVKRALRGMDAYLLIANSRGINVWCAAAGGHFTNHDVVSIFKVSGIEELVDHRTVILPQLAAVGIEAKILKKKTGWKVVWGPVYAKDIPIFIKNNLHKTREMKVTNFSWTERLEMCCAWAFPISILSLILIPFWHKTIIILILLIWSLSLLIFLSFPIYGNLLGSKKKNIGFISLDFGKGGFQIFLLCVSLIVLIFFSILSGYFYWEFILKWGIVLSIVIIVITIDLVGTTPVFNSGLSIERYLKIILDEEKCKVAAFCEDVCPRNCYEIDISNGIVNLKRIDQCIQCGACIVQCPFDALYFKSPDGKIIPPENIRKFKLNLIGKRLEKSSMVN